MLSSVPSKKEVSSQGGGRKQLLFIAVTLILLPGELFGDSTTKYLNELTDIFINSVPQEQHGILTVLQNIALTMDRIQPEEDKVIDLETSFKKLIGAHEFFEDFRQYDLLQQLINTGSTE